MPGESNERADDVGGIRARVIASRLPSGYTDQSLDRMSYMTHPIGIPHSNVCQPIAKGSE